MKRRLIWLQLLIGWLPLWALFAVLIATAHSVPFIGASHIALRMVLAAAALAFFVQRFAERYPWPSRVTPTFVIVHVLAASVYSLTWIALNSLIESAVRGQLVLVVGIGPASFFTLGMWLYVMVAGVSYTALATERAAKAEANAAKAQLAALRSQLNPHFLFNALHTVVHLIPRQPKEAADAAEKLAALLRTAVEEDRDLVTLAEEFVFVTRYLDIERIRFGDRLRVTVHVGSHSRDQMLPSFALQTLVENAVRHGVTPRVEPSDLAIRSDVKDGALTLTVTNSAVADPPTTAPPQDDAKGTGLKRLRERLAVLYGGRARLDLASSTDGFTATLVIPQEPVD